MLITDLLISDNTLLLIGRDKNGLNEVAELARRTGSITQSFCLDLLYFDKIRYLMDEIITVFNKNIHQPGDQIILVNNASIIEPINRFDLLSEKDIEKKRSEQLLLHFLFLEELPHNKISQHDTYNPANGIPSDRKSSDIKNYRTRIPYNIQ